MLDRIIPIALALALIASYAPAQEEQPAPPPDKVKKAEEKKTDKEEPVEIDGKDRIVKVGTKDKVRVLKPKDIPAELLRLKTKADIKAEITVRTTSGRPVTFKGVIRNGKLIERIVKRRFVPQKDLEHPRAGVRVWWSGGSDGYIFFRYSTIKTLAITGKLTAEERREIMRRLKAKREGRDPDANKEASADKIDQELAKMPQAELKLWLLHQYPYDKGWNHKKMRALKRKKLIENKVLTREEEIFVKYFSLLNEAHFEDLKKNTKKIEIEPGSEKDDSGEGAPGEGGFGDPEVDDG